MNSKPVVALPEVQQDLENAIEHYLTWRNDGRGHLLARYDETIGWIAWNPDLFPRKIGRVQRIIVKQTYFIVYFLQEDRRTVVLAVLDGRMKPASIRRQISERSVG